MKVTNQKQQLERSIAIDEQRLARNKELNQMLAEIVNYEQIVSRVREEVQRQCYDNHRKALFLLCLNDFDVELDKYDALEVLHSYYDDVPMRRCITDIASSLVALLEKATNISVWERWFHSREAIHNRLRDMEGCMAEFIGRWHFYLYYNRVREQDEAGYD